MSASDEGSFSLERPKRNDFQNVEDFINAAGKTNEEIQKDNFINEILPWKEDHVRVDHRVGYNVRMIETYYLKLKWLSDQSKCDDYGRQIKRKGTSLSGIIQEILYEGLDKKVKKKLKEIGRDEDI